MKRQERFKEYEVNHINDYIRLRRKDKSMPAIPHLIIIVDEFAELKTEYPDFMKELVSAARIGRTLGVHLILATQKPSGVVDPQIWSNSKFKLCLKVQSKDDSNEIIKTPLAADIVEPGRAYFQVGNNEIFELFQSAYSGAKVPSPDAADDRVFSIKQLNMWGQREVIHKNKTSSSGEDDQNQLKALVEYLALYCTRSGVNRLPSICLPSLPDSLSVDNLKSIRKEATDILVPIGLYDAPQLQLQETLVLNLSQSNTYIIGSSQSGKTTLLQTILRGLIDGYSPKAVNAYMIADPSLKVFEKAKQVGGVCSLQEEERVENLFRMLHKQVKRRKEIFAEKSVGTYRAYLEAGLGGLPEIFVLIDNITAFRDYYQNYDDDILYLSREGLGVGIRFILTAPQTNSVGYKALSNFATRLALQCNDAGEYAALFDRCRITPFEIPGRGLCMIDKAIYEFQTALPAKGEKEIERRTALKEWITQKAAACSDLPAPPIPQVPALLRESDVIAQNPPASWKPYTVPIGIRYDNVDMAWIDLTQLGSIAITGREKSGRTNFIMGLLKSLQKNILQQPVEVYIIDSPEGQLQSAKKMFGFIKHYTIDVLEAEPLVEMLATNMEERQKRIAENANQLVDDMLRREPLVVLIAEGNAFFEEIGRRKELDKALLRMIKLNRKMKFLAVFSGIDNSAIPLSGIPETQKSIKENRRVLLFDDYANLSLIQTETAIKKLYPNPISIGDAFWCDDKFVTKIKTILST